MPKDEFDPDDPIELCGMALFTEEDTSEAMTECFIEEFMRLGYNHKQLLALFRNPHYTGMNMVLQNKGEQFIRDRIEELFARWGRKITWHGPIKQAAVELRSADFSPLPSLQTEMTGERTEVRAPLQCSTADSVAVDPMGGIIPQDILTEAAETSHRSDSDRVPAPPSACGSSHAGCTCGSASTLQRFNDLTI